MTIRVLESFEAAAIISRKAPSGTSRKLTSSRNTASFS
jgi:hypothetical protein